MSISSQPTRRLYTCLGTTGPYSFPYRFLSDEDLAVTRIAADGTRTLLTLTTDYTVSGAGEDSGGAVTTVASYANGRIEVWLDVEIEQPNVYQTNDPFPAKSVENGLDRLTLIDAQQQELLDRAILTEVGEGGFTLPPVADREGLPARWDDEGDLIGGDINAEEVIYDDLDLKSYLDALQPAAIFDTYDDLHDVPTALGEVEIRGCDDPDDLGGGRFRFVPTSVANSYRGVIAHAAGFDGAGRWVRVEFMERGVVNPRWLGATGDLQNLLDTQDVDPSQANPTPGQLTLEFDPGQYLGGALPGGVLQLDKPWQTLRGTGRGAVVQFPIERYAKSQLIEGITSIAPVARQGVGLSGPNTKALNVVQVTDAGGGRIDIWFDKRHRLQNTSFAVLTLATGPYAGEAALIATQTNPFALRAPAAFAGTSTTTAVLTNAWPMLSGEVVGFRARDWAVGMRSSDAGHDQGRIAFTRIDRLDAQNCVIGFHGNGAGEVEISNSQCINCYDCGWLITQGSVNMSLCLGQKIEGAPAGILLYGDEMNYTNHVFENYFSGINFALGDGHNVFNILSMAEYRPAHHTGLFRGRDFAITVTRSSQRPNRLVIDFGAVAHGVFIDLTTDEGSLSPQQITTSAMGVYTPDTYDIAKVVNDFKLEIVETYISNDTGTGEVTGYVNSLTLAAGASNVDDAYRGQELHVTSGPGMGQKTTIVSYNGTTQVVTLRDTFATGVDTSSTYDLYGIELTLDVVVSHYFRELYPLLLLTVQTTDQDDMRWINSITAANKVVVSGKHTTTQTGKLVWHSDDFAATGRRGRQVETTMIFGAHISAMALSNTDETVIYGRVKARLMLFRNVTNTIRYGSLQAAFGGNPFYDVEPFFPDSDAPHGYGAIAMFNRDQTSSYTDMRSGSGRDYGARVPDAKSGLGGIDIDILHITDAGGGYCLLELDGFHLGRANYWPFKIAISLSDDKDGTYWVQDYPDTTTIKIKATYTTDQQGVVTLLVNKPNAYNAVLANGYGFVLETAGLDWEGRADWGTEGQPELRAPDGALINAANIPRIMGCFAADGVLTGVDQQIGIAGVSKSGAQYTIQFNRSLPSSTYNVRWGVRVTGSSGSPPANPHFAEITKNADYLVLEARTGSSGSATPYTSGIGCQFSLSAPSWG